jgi:acetyl esterase/lipase
MSTAALPRNRRFSRPRTQPWRGTGRVAAWVVLAGLSAVLLGAEFRSDEPPPGVIAYREIAYRVDGGRTVRLDLYVPEGAPPPGGRPLVVAIHGGGWRGGSKDLYGRMAARLATHGYAVAAVGYRLSKPGQPGWPSNFEDVREAVRWLRRHAEDYGLDPDRVVAMGSSAGGHLALMLGAYPDGPVTPEGRPGGNHTQSSDVTARVDAVVSFYGPADLARLDGVPIAGESVEALLGGPPTSLPGRCEAASPINHVSPDDPPVLLIHGDKDATVPIDQGHRLARVLGAAGVTHRLVVIPGAGHGFGFRVGGRDLLPDILEFLRETWDHTR